MRIDELANDDSDELANDRSAAAQSKREALQSEMDARKAIGKTIRDMRKDLAKTKLVIEEKNVSSLPGMALGALTQVTELDFSESPIRFLPPSLQRLQRLEKLNLNGTRLGNHVDTVFKLAAAVPKLKEIYLNDTLLPPRAVTELKNFKHVNSGRITVQYNSKYRKDWLHERLIDKTGATQTLEDQFKAAQGKKTLSLAFVDLDYFGQINKTHGELVGDMALRHFCSVVDAVAGEKNVFARWGGEEFLLLAPGKGGASKANTLLCPKRQRRRAASIPPTGRPTWPA